MRIAYWKPSATNKRSEYVIFIAFPLQQWLHERGSMLRYTYTACIVKYNLDKSSPLKGVTLTAATGGTIKNIVSMFFCCCLFSLKTINYTKDVNLQNLFAL
jgi:hypothetical protein